MSLAVRVIPTLLVRDGLLVKGKKFSSWRVVGNGMQGALVHAARYTDELILLDVSATPQGRGPDLTLVEKLAEKFRTPLTVGGGVRSVDDVRSLLRAGADKVSIGTGCYEVPDLLLDCAEYFGNQCIVMAIDVLGGNTVMYHCGKHGYNHDPVYTAKWAQDNGAGEILLTSIDREGTMEGYDLDLIRQVAEAVDIPVIAHGGCSGPDDMIAAVRAGASAVAAGSLLQFTDWTPKACAEYLAHAGIETRVSA